MADNQTKQAFCAKLGAFYNREDLADLTLICDGHRWNVHRLVLSLHSDVLSKWCIGELKESSEGELDLSAHFTPEHATALVEYMYTFNYIYTTADSFSDTIQFHIGMAILGDMYEIPGLHKLAASNFSQLSLDNAKDLATAANFAYMDPPATQNIRDSVVAAVIARKGLLDNKDGKPLAEAMEQNSGFALAVARRLARLVPTSASRK